MKKLFSLVNTLAVLLLCTYCFAQPPEGINYQGIARNNFGKPLANAHIKVQFSIRNITAGGTVIYQEEHTDSTNVYGLFTLKIGTVTPQIGTFPAIPWSTGDKFLEVKIDTVGGNNYILMGTTQMMSVPYALYAKTAGTSGTAGITGATGSQGSLGNQGTTGSTGATGTTGFLPNGSAAGNTTYWDGTTWVLNSNNIYNNGGNVGIGTGTPGTSLEVNGAVTLSPNSVSTNSSTLSPGNRGYLRLLVGFHTFTSISTNGAIPGQILVLENNNITSNITIKNGPFVHLDEGVHGTQTSGNGSEFVMGITATLTLIFNGSAWIEIARSGN